jgi:GAF domain-containing protein
MPRQLIERYLQNPFVIGAVAAAAVIIVGVILLLLLRSRRQKRERESRVRSELVAMEREAQFSSASDQLPYQKNPLNLAQQIASIFEEYLRLDVPAIYAGREREDYLHNILTVDQGAEQPGAGHKAALPDSVSALLFSEYWKPQVTSINALLRGSSTPAQPEVAEVDQAPGDAGDAGDAANDAQALAAAEPSANVIVIPWRGPFDWRGVILARPIDKADAEALNRYRDPLARLTDRLAVSLELETEQRQLEALDERSSRAANFSKSLIASLDEQTPLAAIARNVTDLTGAESAALWRVEPGASMVRMVAAYGLRSAEFLPLPIGQGLAGSVAQGGQSIAIEDAPADPRCIFPREARESGIGSYLGAPIRADGQIIGIVEAHTAGKHRWTDNDIRALESAADLLAEILKSTDTRGNRLRVEGAYLGLSEALQRLRSKDEVMEAAVEVLGHALGVSRAVVVEFDDKGKPQPVKQEYRTQNVKPALGATFDETLYSRVASDGEGEPKAVSDSRADSLMGAEAAAELQVLSELAVPVRVEGSTRAIIYLHQCDRVREWQRDEVEFADRVARQLSLSMTNLKSLESATHESERAREDARRLGEATGRAQAIINTLPEAIIGLDAEGRISFFNSEARQRFGLGNADLGRAAEKTDSLALADEGAWPRIAASDGVLRFQTQAAFRDASGSAGQAARVPVSVAVAPMRNSRGEINGHLVVISEPANLGGISAEASSRIAEMETQMAALERALGEARNADTQSRTLLAKAQAAEARARAETEVIRRSESDWKQEREQLREDAERVQRSAQQLLEINRLKSEFIVNAGREIEASLQSVLGFAELLDQGSYGQLTPEQREAVRGIYAWSRRIKTDVEWLIEYGSTRSRRLEQGDSEEEH